MTAGERPITRKDVAERAQTSVTVVSYVINNGPRNVRPETRERVLAAIRDLGYRANSAARSLRTKRTMAIGLVVPDASNPFFGKLAREIEEEAFLRGYALLVGNAMENNRREVEHIRALLGRQVDGLIIAPCSDPDLWWDELAKSPTSAVILDRALSDHGLTHVVVDNEQGAYLATRHLLEHGRRRIGCVAGPQRVHPTTARVNGWRRALAEVGAAADDAPVSYGQFRQSDGFEAGLTMLRHPGRPDAIFTTSDEQAIGIIAAAAHLGLDIPGDVALVGFDGIDSGEFTVPPLTTVQQPLSELARRAVDRVIDQVAEPRRAELIELETRLVLRRSCGCEYAVHSR